MITDACQKIADRIRIRTRKKTKGTRRRVWTNNREETNPQLNDPKEETLYVWRERWSQQRTNRTHWDQFHQPPDSKILKLHRQLKKLESSTLIQMRTGRTGLAHFLSSARVPEFPSKQCECGQGWETPRHVLMECTFEDDRRPRREEGWDFVRLLDTPEGAQVLTKWMIQSGRLQQFRVANSLLYDSSQ